MKYPEEKERFMPYTWKAATGGKIPDGAQSNGFEADGTPLWTARANYQGGVHPGKVRPAFGGANIPYGGNEVKVPDYEVLMERGNWVPAAGGQVPTGAVPAGKEADGTVLYVARARYAGGLHQGKVRPAFKAANIPYGGHEIKVHDYEVLVD
jgi:hypothetical protein